MCIRDRIWDSRRCSHIDYLSPTGAEIRDGDPFFIKHIASYELIPWNVVIGREGLDKL